VNQEKTPPCKKIKLNTQIEKTKKLLSNLSNNSIRIIYFIDKFKINLLICFFTIEIKRR
jgi:hypothetical protein